VAPETLNSPQIGAKTPREEPQKTKSKNIKNLWGNCTSEGKMSINTWENIKSESWLS